MSSAVGAPARRAEGALAESAASPDGAGHCIRRRHAGKYRPSGPPPPRLAGRLPRSVPAPRASWSARVIAAALIVLPAVSACREPAPDQPAAGTLNPVRGLNVLLISLDTTRADHLGCYGRDDIATPHIDRLAAQGARFTQCISPAPTTLTSHTSLMTATYPFVHGVRDNGDFRVDENNLTLAEVFRDAGYATAAQIGAFVLNHEFGLDQGFEYYEDIRAPRPAGQADDPLQTRARMRVGSATRRGDDVADGAIRWLRDRPADRPFFLFVHFFDPHEPYDPPPPFDRQYPDPYAGEIAFVDTQVGRVLAEIDRLGLARDTLVVLTADHGESLGEHGEATHSLTVYDATQRVPLIIRCPRLVPAGLVIDAQVRLIDIAPTILAATGLPPLPDAQGVSLWPLILGQRADLDLPAYSEAFTPYLRYGYSQVRALRAEGWKYIHTPRAELYHLTEDPRELTNLAARFPQRVEAMRSQLRDLLTHPRVARRDTRDAGPLDEAQRQQLMALGYLAGAAGSEDNPQARLDVDELELFEPLGEDVKDHLAELSVVMLGWGAMFAEQFAKAEALFRQAVERDPDNIAFRMLLADALVEQDKSDEALDQYMRILELDPDFHKAMLNAGNVYARAGDYEKAARWYRQAIRKAPEYARGRYNLAYALAALGRTEEAIDQYEATLAIAPGYRAARENLARLLVEKGDFARAIDHLRELVEADPRDPRRHVQLGLALARSGRLEPAADAFRQALRLDPTLASARNNLAAVLEQMGRTEEAIAEYRQTLQTEPEHGPAAYNLARLLAAAGRFDEAIDVLTGYAAHRPLPPPAALLLASILQKVGNEPAARDALRRAHHEHPGEVSVATALLWTLAASPDPSVRSPAEAAALATRLLGDVAQPTPDLLDAAAAASAANGDFQRAIDLAREAEALARKAGDHAHASRIAARRRLYEAGQPFVRPSAAPPDGS